MGYLGKGTENLSCVVLKEKKNYIKDRAHALGWSASQFGGGIVDWYFAQGAPSLHPKDTVLQIPKFPEKNRYERI